MKTIYSVLLGFLILTAGCDNTRRDLSVCSKADPTCLSGYTCNITTYRCVPIKDAALDVAIDTPIDTMSDTVTDIIGDVPGKLDKPIDEKPIDAAVSDAGIIDTKTPDTLAPDTHIPDAGGSCLVNGDCAAGNAYCVNFRCVACKDHSQCNNDAGVPFCSTANTCVSCAGVDAGCSGGNSVCHATSGRCVECVDDIQCSKFPEKAFCQANVCVGCAKDACSGATPVCGPSGACVECLLEKDCSTIPGKPICKANVCVGCAIAGCSGATVCGPSGACVECLDEKECKSSEKAFCKANVCVGCAKAACSGATVCAPSGACVECVDDKKCKEKNVDKAFCRANICVGCKEASSNEDNACGGSTPVCNNDNGRCVECLGSDDCKSVNKKFCQTNRCVGCKEASSGGANVCTDPKPACATSGACVECVASSDCKVAEKPICDTDATKCKACTDDGECESKLGSNPGLCMSHQGGRCATDLETIFVNNTGSCSGTGGTAQNPYCGLQNAFNAAVATKKVIVVRGTNVAGFSTSKAIGQITLVGKNGATVQKDSASSAAIELSGTANLYARDLGVVGNSGGNNIGIKASSGTTLQLLGVKVLNNERGGILIDGASFDLKNVLVLGNGTGIDGAILWSGIYLKSVPTGGSRNLSHVSVSGNSNNGLVCTSTSISLSVNATYIGGNTVTPDILNCPASATSCSPPAANSCGSNLTAP